MADIPTQLPPSNSDQVIPANLGPQHQGILDQTLGEVLKSNPQAQNLVMQSMHVSPEKFQQLLKMADNNALMNTKIRELFSNGVVQQALAQQGQNVQVTPEQPSQVQNDTSAVAQSAQQPSLLQKIKGLLGF